MKWNAEFLEDGQKLRLKVYDILRRRKRPFVDPDVYTYSITYFVFHSEDVGR